MAVVMYFSLQILTINKLQIGGRHIRYIVTCNNTVDSLISESSELEQMTLFYCSQKKTIMLGALI